MTTQVLADALLRLALILLTTLAIRRVYLSSPLTADRVARYESLASAAEPFSWTWFWATVGSCQECLTYWLAAAATVAIVLIPYWTGSDAILWFLAIPALAYLANSLDPNPRNRPSASSYGQFSYMLPKMSPAAPPDVPSVSEETIGSDPDVVPLPQTPARHTGVRLGGNTPSDHNF